MNWAKRAGMFFTGPKMFGLAGRLPLSGKGILGRLALPGLLVGGYTAQSLATSTLDRLAGYGGYHDFGTPPEPYNDRPMMFGNGGNFSNMHLQATGSSVFAMHNMRKG